MKKLNKRIIQAVRNFPACVDDYDADLPGSKYGYEEPYGPVQQAGFRDGWFDAVNTINKMITEMKERDADISEGNLGIKIKPVKVTFRCPKCGKEIRSFEKFFYNKHEFLCMDCAQKLE